MPTMERESYRDQILTLLKVQATLVVGITLAVSVFWASLCGSSLESCVAMPGEWGIDDYLLLSFVRPFLFTPFFFMGLIGGSHFGPVGGTLMNALGATASCLTLYLPAKFFGRRLVMPWLAANFPATFHLLREQDHKFVFLTRLIPFLPFDLLSITFGLANFSYRAVIVGTLVGSLPSSYMYAQLVSPSPDAMRATATALLAFAFAVMTPMAIYEISARQSGSSLWTRLKHVWQEIVFEVRANNEMVRRTDFTKDDIPVILIYGFFSSRRVLAMQERHLTRRGYKVMSFNLGGLFGVFFTSSIKATAALIDQKLRRQRERYGFQKVRIIAHSKGGLVAMWWLLKMGGHQYCDLLVTMATPFRGSPFTWAALATPLGYFTRDLWEMRPSSQFLQDMTSTPLPENLHVYCLYSRKDLVARGRTGIYHTETGAERVTPVAMHHVGHTEFLARRDVGDVLLGILEKEDLRSRAAAVRLEPVEVLATADDSLPNAS
jgi:uncharacterized membrane protein YdjX (TVP38/TMEM64 family)/pimeloyl-ACP methyl ester carboxylesterase